MLTRRQLMKSAAVSGAATLVGSGVAGSALAQASGSAGGGALDAASVAKYVTALPVLPAMPRSGRGAGTDSYEIAARRFVQQILPADRPATPVFGYGAASDPRSFHFPAYPVEATVDRPVQVTWSNQLLTRSGSFQPHLFPLDGPVALVTHLHGGYAGEESDGHPDAWYLPAAHDIPAGVERVGAFYEEFRAAAGERFGAAWRPGTAVHHYGNHQRPTALWFHATNRANTYAGLTGLYLLRGAEDLPAGYREIPLVIQDRAFNADGTLSFTGTADTMLVNGRSWPVLTVEPRRYRLRVLNACDRRTLNLRIATDSGSTALPIWVIGADGGFLPAPAQVQELPAAVAERHDIIVDFTGLRPGTELYLVNDGPGADPETTGQIMKFAVTKLSNVDRSARPDELTLPGIAALGRAARTRRLSLTGDGELGTLAADGRATPARWSDEVSETPARGSTEIWELHNRTGEAQPVHVRQVQFEVLGRRGADGRLRVPMAWERGRKDTVLAPAGEVTRLKARFDLPGRYAWHGQGGATARPYQVV